MAVQPNDDNTPDITIDDPEQLSQTRRIKEILERRYGVLEARNRAIDELTMSDIDESQAIRHYHSRLESLILDLWTKFERMDIKETDEISGEDYLYNITIDTVLVPPPTDMLQNGERDAASGVSYPDPKTVTINGLAWFIENDLTVTETFELVSWVPPDEDSKQNERVVPRRTLDKALITCMEFIDKAGIDAEFETNVDDAEFKYNELLDDE